MINYIKATILNCFYYILFIVAIEKNSNEKLLNKKSSKLN